MLRQAQHANRTLTRSRTSALITPEHYAYVKKDLRMIAALAVLVFAVIVVLAFMLPS
jgi:hypothetical protein